MKPTNGQKTSIADQHRPLPICRFAATMIALLVPVFSVQAELGDISSGEYYARPWESPNDLIFTGPSGTLPMGWFSGNEPLGYSLWWDDYGVRTNRTANNYASVTRGQLRWMALCAATMLDSAVSRAGGAGTNVWATFPIPPQSDSNAVLATVGELKEVVLPFAERVTELFADEPFGGYVPDWLLPDENDDELANLGQLKYLFDFSFQYDVNENTIPDWWERWIGLRTWLDSWLPCPVWFDTDRDGRSDALEYAWWSDPLNPDENGDGIPDGMTSFEWRSHPLWGANAGRTNLVIRLESNLSSGSAILVLGTLPVPMRNVGEWHFCVPEGEPTPFELFVFGGTTPILTVSPPADGITDPIHLYDPDGVFSIVLPDEPSRFFPPRQERSGAASGGGGHICVPNFRIVYVADMDSAIPDECIHGTDGVRQFTVSSSCPEIHGRIPDYASKNRQPDGSYRLSVTTTPCDSDLLVVRYDVPTTTWGSVEHSVSIHRCAGGVISRCGACHRYHDEAHACSHEPGCAARSSLESACTCEGLYVHVATNDEDGNGVPDRADNHWVGSWDLLEFTTLGDSACCCAHRYDPCPTVAITACDSNLRARTDSEGFGYGNSPVNGVWVQALSPSGCVGGSHVTYAIRDADGHVLRTISLPITAYDVVPTNLRFNHDEYASDHDAINLRRNGTATGAIDLTGGEWVASGNALYAPSKQEPACWVGGVVPVVKARLTVCPADIASVRFQGESLSNNRMLCGISPTTVSFANGVSVPEYVPLALDGAVPAAVDRLTGEGWRWQTLSVNGHAVPPATFCTNGPSVAYSIFAEPLPPWTNAPNHVQNAWTEALDYVSEVSQCLWTGSPESLMNVLTSHFFDGTLYKYSFTEPIPHFFIESNQSFDLSRYLVRPSSLNIPVLVDCEDQAYGLAIVGRLCGASASVLSLSPFGYINPTHIVGFAPLCNNPGFLLPGACPAANCDINALGRQGFLCHLFVLCDGGVYDSCLGPFLGDRSVEEYFECVVDSQTSLQEFARGNPENTNTVFSVLTLH